MRLALLGFSIAVAALVPVLTNAWSSGGGTGPTFPGPDYNPGVQIWAVPQTITVGESTTVSFRAPLASDNFTSSPEPDVSENCTTNFTYTEISDETITGYPWGTMGQKVDSPTVTTTYTATCRLVQTESASGVTYRYDTQSVTVTVNPAPAGVDLTAGSITPTETPKAATLSATVSNTGAAATSGGFFSLFQRATDAGGTGATDIGTYNRTTALPGSANFVASLSYTFPSPGTWYVRACADKNSGTNPGTVAETDENNNCGAWTPVVVEPQCSDELDNNGAGGTDYPNDASCNGTDDDSEDGVALSCSANPSAISVPGTVTYTAANGTGSYSWTPSALSTICDPNPGNPTVCTITAPGEHSMTVTSGSSALCEDNVIAGCAASESVSLTANGQSDTARVQVGGNVTLAWQISGIEPPTTCSLTGVGDVTPTACTESDSQSVGPVTTQQVYTLTCGGVSDSVIVNVASGAIEF